MKIVTLFWLLVIIFPLHAQHVMNYVFQSPQTAALTSEVQTPVSLSSGRMNVEIPIYTLQQGSIQVPISLSYDASGIKVSAHPGITGQNWTLKAGGMVCRIVKDLPDETHNLISSSLRGFLEASIGYRYGFWKLNREDWNSVSTIQNWVENMSGSTELEPDEFIFNFCGHSGRFYIDHTGKPVIVGQEGYKITVCFVDNVPQFNPSAPSNYLSRYSWVYDAYPKEEFCYTVQTITGFEITDPQGVKYYFGVYKDAVETNADFFAPIYNETTTAWYLKKIVAPDKREVNFQYECNYPVVNFATTHVMNEMEIKTRPGIISSYRHIYREGSYTSGSLIFSPYLISITTPDMTVRFNYSDSHSMDYNYVAIQTELDRRAIDSYDRYMRSARFGIYPIAESKLIVVDETGKFVQSKVFKPNLIKWKKLDEISVTWNQDTEQSIKYQFTYRDNRSERLQLTTLQKVGGNLKVPAYRFIYNNNKKLPGFLDVRTDHWGYFNNVVAPFSNLANYAAFRNAQSAYADSEVLRKIIYPTGGSKEFVYESNRYSQVVHRDKNTGDISVVPVSETTGGGLRIKEIIEKLSDNSVATKKKYAYSGGILNGEIQYYWPGYKQKLKGKDPYVVNRFVSYSLLPVSENPAGGVVSYSKVTESQSGNGRIEYTYTNHDTAPDENAVSTDPQKSAYSPLSSRSQLRGLLLSKKVYGENSSNVLESTDYTYTAPDDSKYIRCVLQRGYDISGDGEIDAYDASAYKIYTFPVLLASEVKKSYYDNSSTPYQQKKTYSYNTLNQVKRETIYGSRNIDASYPLHSTKNEYVIDVYTADTTNTIYKNMVDKNILTPLVKQIESTRKNIIKEVWNDYSWYDSIPYIHQVRVSNNGGTFRVEYQCQDLDKYGNPVNIDNKGVKTFYLWGYNYLRPIAEIKNVSSHSAIVDSLGGKASVEALCSSLAPDISKLTSLHDQFPQSQVTLYDYRPMMGISTKISPNKEKIYYDYDSLGRLIQIRDEKNNIIEAYTYHYGNN